METFLKEFDQIEIAAVNSPESVTVAGCEQQLESLADRLTEADVFNRLLTVEVPYHSKNMEPIKPQLAESLAALSPRSAQIPIYSTVTSELITGGEFDAGYWWRNVRQPVLFGDAIANIATQHPEAIFFEVGPHPVLKTSIKQTLVGNEADRNRQSFCLHRKQPERQSFYRSIAQLFAMGQSVDWHRVNEIDGEFFDLPAYPWSQQEYRRTSERADESLFGLAGHPYFFEQTDGPDPAWEVEVNEHLLPWIDDHVVNQQTVFPGAGYVEAALAFAYHQQQSQNFAIQDIEFQRVLLCQEEQQTRLQTSFHPPTSLISIHSSTVGQSDSWTLHARGKLVENCVSQAASDSPRCHKQTPRQPIDVNSFYQTLEDRGLKYGPQFRTVKELSKHHQDTVVAKLELQSIDDSDYILHPTMLDGAFQSMLALLDSAEVGERQAAFVPISIERVNFHQPVPRQATAISSAISITDTELVADIELQ